MIPIMIVEDEFLVRISLKSLVDWNSYGFYIVADASNGQEGLELYKKHHPYLIITDIRMTPVSGLEMMKEIRSMDDEVKFIVISAYNDFEYAQQAISYGVELYLSKSTFKNEDLAQILPKIRESYSKGNKKAEPALPSSPLNFNSAFPDITDSDAICRQLSENGLDTGMRLLLAGRFDRSYQHRDNNTMLHTILKNLLECANITFQLYIRKDFMICLCKTNDQNCLINIGKEAHQTLLNYTMTPCFFGISAPLEENSRLFRALSEACLACNEFVFDKNIICRTFSAQSTALNFGTLNLDTTLEELLSSVFSNAKDKTLSTIGKIIHSCKNYRSLERALFSILSSFIEYDSSSSLSSLLETYLRKDDIEKIIVSLNNWIYALPFNSLPTGSSSREYVDTVITYIKDHPEDNLSIQFLASKVHLSPNYLGKIFYQHTGVFINQYITKYRINKACDLLLQTDLPVNTIGNMVGIPNPHYFSRLFRETMGQSPSKYRLHVQEEEKP